MHPSYPLWCFNVIKADLVYVTEIQYTQEWQFLCHFEPKRKYICEGCNKYALFPLIVMLKLFPKYRWWLRVMKKALLSENGIFFGVFVVNLSATSFEILNH